MKYIARSSLKSNSMHWKTELQGLEQSQVSSTDSSKSFKRRCLKGGLGLLEGNDLSLTWL